VFASTVAGVPAADEREQQVEQRPRRPVYMHQLIGGQKEGGAAQHLAELGIIVERQRRAMHANQRFAVAHIVDDRAFLEIAQRQVAVGHQHQAVELREILRREEAHVECRRLLLVSLAGRPIEAAALAEQPFRKPRGLRSFSAGSLMRCMVLVLGS